jgi:hypothetical protein
MKPSDTEVAAEGMATLFDLVELSNKAPDVSGPCVGDDSPVNFQESLGPSVGDDGVPG